MKDFAAVMMTAASIASAAATPSASFPSHLAGTVPAVVGLLERVLPGSVLRKLTDAEMTEYRKPFLNREDRWPTLTWPRQIPIAGEPADVVAIVDAYAKWMAENDVPKLFVNAEPGAILIGKVREFCRGWKNQTEVTVSGSHFIQEDSGPAIGRAIADWIKAKGV